MRPGLPTYSHAEHINNTTIVTCEVLDPAGRLWHQAEVAGTGHVRDTIVLAKQQGLNPERWFDTVERAMLLLSQQKYAAKARHGYVRGQEPVNYVREIQRRYNAYVRLTKATANNQPAVS